MNKNDLLNEFFMEADEDELEEYEEPRLFNRRITIIDPKTDEAFEKSSERLHKKHSELNKTFSLSFLVSLACVILAAFAARQFFAEPTAVDGESMQYTLLDGERLFVEKVSYWLREPQRGDIVIVKYPGRDESFVKRIVGLPGETVEVKDGFVFIDGNRLDESAYAGDWYGHIWLDFQYYKDYFVEKEYPPVYEDWYELDHYPTVVVPEGHYFVIGDNRNDSTDSRDPSVGSIPIEDVIGRVVAVIWPFKNIRKAN